MGSVLDCETGLERAVRVRVAAAWKQWREIASLPLRELCLVRYVVR